MCAHPPSLPIYMYAALALLRSSSILLSFFSNAGVVSSFSSLRSAFILLALGSPSHSFILSFLLFYNNKSHEFVDSISLSFFFFLILFLFLTWINSTHSFKTKILALEPISKRPRRFFHSICWPSTYLPSCSQRCPSLHGLNQRAFLPISW